MKSLALVRILLGVVCSVIAACAASDGLDHATDVDDGDLAVANYPLTLPAAERAVPLINADDPAYWTQTPLAPAASGLALDAALWPDGTPAADVRLGHWLGQDSQRWALDMPMQVLDTTSPRALSSAASGLCLEPTTTSYSDGTPVALVPCSGAPVQRWVHNRSGQIEHRNSAKCLDANASSGSIGAGTRMQLWTCHGGGNQKWRFGSTILRSAASGRCLDVNAPNGQVGTTVQIWDCHGGANQRWRRGVTYVGGATFVGDANGNCLTATGLANGSAVVFQPCTQGAGTQLFSYRADGSMYHQSSRRCLDVANDGRVNGTGLQLYDCHGGPNQRWSTR